ncbi:hypothetical protein IE81DRAFT_328950 [Ceraceosorus guamensis]|uniref:Myb-like domain-containing protein n=1 Tax=Ceraceosorus guamensis TaxID=1522189 RepID=A0A316W4X3_9BASI|nr:hypothetical protein IE81DRAFT_328950 [Ceraceosorus guamensis]PWN44178.1 hypothetical protein IE81DRAFT_328950 [Ceraceosorus guamensis]
MAPKKRSSSPSLDKGTSSAPSSPKKGRAAAPSWTDDQDRRLLLAYLAADGQAPPLSEAKKVAMASATQRSEEAVRQRWKNVVIPAVKKMIENLDEQSLEKAEQGEA